MDKNEHTLRKQLRTAIDMALGDPMSIGDAVEVGVMAAEVYATAVRPPKEPVKAKRINVVSWPIEGQAPMRQALGYYEQADALAKANSTADAEIFMLDVS